jgi:ABC-type transporter Mla subunit MlaD
MPHHSPRPYAGAHVRLEKARAILDENKELLARINAKAAQNTNEVLRYLVETLNRVETDLIHLHSKLQPILKSLEEDADWRSRIPREERE